MTQERTCDNCRFSIMRDQGYSNYTVEGTEFSCAWKLHPDGSFDRFYRENPQLEYAQQCHQFEAGEGLHIDVEEEALDDLSPQHQELLRIEQTAQLIRG